MQCLHTLVLCFVEFEHPYMLFCSEQVEARLTNSTISLKQACSSTRLHPGTLRLLEFCLCGFVLYVSQLQIFPTSFFEKPNCAHWTHFQKLRGLPHKKCCKPLCHCQGWLCTYSIVTFECRFTNPGFLWHFHRVVTQDFTILGPHTSVCIPDPSSSIRLVFAYFIAPFQCFWCYPFHAT